MQQKPKRNLDHVAASRVSETAGPLKTLFLACLRFDLDSQDPTLA